MKRLPVRRVLPEMGLWLLFVALYAAPVGSLFIDLAVLDYRVTLLVGQAFDVWTVRLETARNVLVHLALITAYYLWLRWIAGHLLQVFSIRPVLIHLCVLIAGWLFLLAGNAIYFPVSGYSIAFDAVATPITFILTAGALGLATLLGVWRAVRPWLHQPPAWVALAAAGLLGVIAVPLYWDAQAHVTQSERNVIILGIDSLSGHVWENEKEHFPNLSALMAHATQYERAYTPLARTFPAWTSILSGEAPAVHGAVFNLRNLEHVRRDHLISHALQQKGYRTVFAMDERRFNNMDQSFGFDRVVGSKVGILDFVLQAFNDTPLTNLLLQTPLGAHALPYSNFNVASYANYDALGFVDQIAQETEGAQRLFLATHFLSGHFPFKSRFAQIRLRHENIFYARHIEALTAIDMQVGELMDRLKEQGHLRDALVIVLSDHGEAFGFLEAEYTEGGRPMQLATFGHGSNVLSDQQNRIVLATIRFRDGVPVPIGHHQGRHEQVSLLDVRATIERFVAGDDNVSVVAKNECMTVETGFRVSAAEDYRTLDAKKVAGQGMGFYEVDSKGRMRFRESELLGLVMSKDVGLRCADRITYYRHSANRHFSFALSDGGRSLTEIEVVAEDVEKVTRYRQALIEQAGGSAQLLTGLQ